MSKMSKAIAVLGVVAGLGVAALPLSTYAADPWGDAYTQSATAQVQVEVGGAISIATSIDGTNFDTTTKTVDLGELMPGSATTDANVPTLKVQVTSNASSAADFALYMNGLEKNTNMVGKKTGATIPTGTTVKKGGESAWGYKLATGTAGEAFTDGETYTAIKAEPEQLGTDGTIANKGESQTFGLKFGVAASTTQTPDTYIGNVVFTAVLK